MSYLMTAQGRVLNTVTFSSSKTVTITDNSILSTSILVASRVNNPVDGQLYFATPSAGSVVLQSVATETSTCNYMVIN